MREGVRVIASNACFGLIPLRCIFFGSAESGRRAQGNSGEDRFSRCAHRVFGLVGAGWRNKVSDHEDSPMYSPLGSGMGRGVGGEPVERCFRSWGDQWSSLVLPAVAVT